MHTHALRGTRAVAVGAAVAATVAGCASAQPAAVPIPDAQTVRNVVLVHGAFADGSGWRGVYDDLTARGYRVTIVQNPLTSLALPERATHCPRSKRSSDPECDCNFLGGVLSAAFTCSIILCPPVLSFLHRSDRHSHHYLQAAKSSILYIIYIYRAFLVCPLTPPRQGSVLSDITPVTSVSSEKAMSTVKWKAYIENLSTESLKRFRLDSAPIATNASMTIHHERSHASITSDREKLHIKRPFEKTLAKIQDPKA